jgi:hypothetical protein
MELPGNRGEVIDVQSINNKNLNHHGVAVTWINSPDTRAGHLPLSCAIFAAGSRRTW